MTLIVGILCQDGVVVASDSAATYGDAGIPTIGQQPVTKVHKLADSVIFSTTGAVGIAQLYAEKIRSGWENDEFKAMKAPELVMDAIGKKIAQTVGPYLQTANLSRPLVGDCSPSLCKALVAMPVKRVPCLFQFDYNGAPEQATRELPFIALGSGQRAADPFLAFLKRLLWKDVDPTLAEGRLAAAWTVDHVRRTDPGGVSGDIQMATLAATQGKQPTVAELGEEEVQEHLEQIEAAEDALVRELRPATAADAEDLPAGP